MLVRPRHPPDTETEARTKPSYLLKEVEREQTEYKGAEGGR